MFLFLYQFLVVSVEFLHASLSTVSMVSVKEWITIAIGATSAYLHHPPKKALSSFKWHELYITSVLYVENHGRLYYHYPGLLKAIRCEYCQLHAHRKGCLVL